MVFSALSIGLMTMFVKLVAEHLPTIQIVFVRGCITLLITIYLLRMKNVSPWGNNKKLLIARGLSATIAIFLIFESIKRFTLSEATVIQYLNPLFTSLIASTVISETFGKNLFYACVLGFAGIYIVLGLPFIRVSQTFDGFSLMIAISGAFLSGVTNVLVRLSTKINEHPYVIMFYFPLLIIPCSLPFVVGNWINPDLKTWFYLIMIGILTQIGQLFYTYGNMLISASKAAITSYIQVPFTVILGICILSEPVTLFFIIGSFVILYSIILSTELLSR